MARDREGRVERVLKRFGYQRTPPYSIHKDLDNANDLLAKMNDPTRPSEGLLLESYRDRIWTYVACYNISQSLAGLPWQLFDVTKGQEKEIKEGKAFDLISKPNRDMGFHELMEGTSVNLDLAGDAYWEKHKNPKTTNIASLFLLHPDKMKAFKFKSGKDMGQLAGWEYTVESNTTKLDREEVVWFHYFSPTDDFDGQGAAEPAWVSSGIDEDALKFSKQFFKNDAIFRGYLKIPEVMGEKDRAIMKAAWAETYGSLTRAFGTPVLEGGATYEKVSLSPDEIALPEMRKLSREEQLACFGVPPGLSGLFEHANWGNIRAQEKIFWTMTAAPRARKIAGAINNQLIPYIKEKGQTLEFRFDFSYLTALMREDRDKSLTIRSYIDRDILTVNEARKMIGMKTDVPWGDQQPSVGKAKATLIADQEIGGVDKVEKGAKERQIWHEEWVEKRVPDFAKKVAKLIEQYGDEVTKNLTGISKAVPRKLEKAGSIPEDLLIWDELKKKLVELDAEEIAKVMQERGDEFFTMFKVSGAFDAASPEVLDQIKTMSMKFSDDVSKTYTDKLRQTLSQGWELGESPQQLTARVQEALKGTTRAPYKKADAVARTEIGKAANTADFDSAKQSDIITGKEWQTAGVGVRASHLDAAADGIIPIDQPFSNGLMHPNDPAGDAGEIVNCRCTLGFYARGEW